MKGRAERKDGGVEQNTNTSFSSDARLSLFQALGLKKDTSPISIGRNNTTAVPIMPYGQSSFSDERRKNSDFRKEEANHRNRRNVAPTTTTSELNQDHSYDNDRFNPRNVRNNQLTNYTTASHTSINNHVDTTTDHFNSKSSATRGTTTIRISQASSTGRIVEIVPPLPSPSLHTPAAAPPPVRILRSRAPPQPSAAPSYSTNASYTAAPISTGNMPRGNTRRSRDSAALPSSVPPTSSTSHSTFTPAGAPHAISALMQTTQNHPSHSTVHPFYHSTAAVYEGSRITAHTHAPSTARASNHSIVANSGTCSSAEDKPVPMLLKILQAAKAKSDQRRTDATPGMELYF